MRGIECWHFSFMSTIRTASEEDLAMIHRPMYGLMILAVLCAPATSAVISPSAAIISDVLFQIEAKGPAGNTSRFKVPLDSGGIHINGDTVTWELSQPMPLLDAQGRQIALLEQANARYVADPIVVLNFLVSSAGGGHFTVTSASLSFATLNNPTGRASAAVTVTDIDGDGAMIAGDFASNEAYRAFYNDEGMVAATKGTFATLTPGASAPAFSSATSSDGFPDQLGGFSRDNEDGDPIPPVSSMSAEWSFSISAGDSASGTSIYVIIPEPGSCLLCLCGLAVLGFMRRR
jgi:hypothetical protein